MDNFESDKSTPGENDTEAVTHVRAPVVQVLHCQVAGTRHDPGQQLVVVTIGEPGGGVYDIALIPDDVSRLRAQLLAANLQIDPKRHPLSALPRLEPHCPQRASQHVQKVGLSRYTQELQIRQPLLERFIAKQVRSLAAAYQRKSNPSAARLFEYRLRRFALVAADTARSDT